MKESELIKKMKAISKKLEESNISTDCYLLVKFKGKEEIFTRCSYTALKYDYARDDLKIHLDDRWTTSNGGGIKVYYKDKIVMHGNKNSKDEEEYYRFNPKIKGYCILTYKPGEWERQVKKYINEYTNEKDGPAEKSIDQDINAKLLKNLKDNFDI